MLIFQYKQGVSLIDEGFLSHFDGSDGATTAVDSSSNNRTISFVGNAQLDTAQSKFGTASLLCDGSGDYVTVPVSTDWSFSTGDLTIDLWARFASLKGAGLVARSQNAPGRWVLYQNNNTIQFWHAIDLIVSASTTVTTNTWYHLAVTRESGITRLFIDGNLEDSSSFSWDDVHRITEPLVIGSDPESPTGRSSNAWLDEVRIIKGEAAWNSNFTPPTSPY